MKISKEFGQGIGFALMRTSVLEKTIGGIVTIGHMLVAGAVIVQMKVMYLDNIMITTCGPRCIDLSI